MKKSEEIKLSTQLMLEASENSINFAEGILNGIQIVINQSKYLSEAKILAKTIESICIKVINHEVKKIQLKTTQEQSNKLSKDAKN